MSEHDLNQQLKELQARVITCENGIVAHQQALTKVTSAMLSNKYTRSVGAVASSFYNGGVTGLKSLYNLVGGGLPDLNSIVTQLASSIVDKVTATAEEMVQQFENMVTSQVSSLTGVVSGLTSQVNSAMSSINSITEQINSLPSGDPQIPELKNQITALQEKLNVVAPELSAQSALLDSFTAMGTDAVKSTLTKFFTNQIDLGKGVSKSAFITKQ
jgi:predicted PurR-regulated permease PerM